MREYPVLDPVSQAYPRVKGRSPTCYSPVRRSCTPKGLTARLACVKHAASVRPEPGSNSPLKIVDGDLSVVIDSMEYPGENRIRSLGRAHQRNRLADTERPAGPRSLPTGRYKLI